MCPANTYSNQVGATSCLTCAPGTNSSAGSSSCFNNGTDTTNVNPISNGGKNNLGAIIGGVIGGVLLIIIVLLILFFFLHRRQSLSFNDPGAVIDLGSHSKYMQNDPSERYGSNLSTQSKIDENESNESYSIPSDQIKNPIKYSDLQIASPTKILGKGAFGIVYLATYMNKQVAVKEILSRSVLKTEMQNFLLEAEVMKQLPEHPNVISFIGLCASPFCIITEVKRNSKNRVNC